MNCLHIDPNTLIKKIYPLRREYDYIFLERLKSYEIPIHIYYHYLLSIEEFKLKLNEYALFSPFPDVKN